MPRHFQSIATPSTPTVLALSSVLPWRPAEREELRALASETDLRFQAEGLLSLASRLEQQSRFALAAELYSTVAGNAANRPQSLRAQGRLDAILGRGATGPRAEFLLRRLAQESTDPSALLAMGVAGVVFRMTRLATLSRLSSATNPGFMTRIFGAGPLASLAGFAVEAPSFTLVSRLGNEALGRGQDWRLSALGRDVASSYLVLGGLRLAGWASAGVYRRLGSGSLREGAFASFAQQGFQQGGTLTGILLGHALEQWTGLRRPQDGSTTLVDSLATLLQFHVSGNLFRGLLGSRAIAWESSMDLSSRRLESGSSGPSMFAWEPRMAGVALGGGERASGEIFPTQVTMAAYKPPTGPSHGGGGRRSVAQQVESVFHWFREEVPASGLRPIHAAVEIRVDGKALESSERQAFYRESLLHLLQGTEAGFPLHLRGELSQALRTHPEFRLSLPQLQETSGLRLHAEFRAETHELKSLLFLDTTQGSPALRRLLLGTQIIRYDENQDPAVYDLEFSPGAAREIRAHVYRSSFESRWHRDEYLNRRYLPETTGSEMAWQWELYPKTSYYLRLSLDQGREWGLRVVDFHLYSLLTLESAVRRNGEGER